MVLAVEIPGVPGRYLADVGYGVTGALLEPLPMIPGQVREGAGRRHRLVVEEPGSPSPVWVMQALKSDGWEDQTAFTLDPAPAPDLNVANWYTATHPRSPFHHLYVQRTLPTGHHLLLHGTTLTRTAPDATETRHEVGTAEELAGLLETEFGITPPPDFHPGAALLPLAR